MRAKGHSDDPNCESETCKNRKYQDGSDDPGVSYKTPTIPVMTCSPLASPTNLELHVLSVELPQANLAPAKPHESSY